MSPRSAGLKGRWGRKTSKVNPHGTPTFFSAAEVFLRDQQEHPRLKFSQWLESVGGAFRKIAFASRGAVAEQFGWRGDYDASRIRRIVAGNHLPPLRVLMCFVFKAFAIAS
jgi:hypothetical protein